MARQTPPDRLERLVGVATEVFIEHGYRRTQMADIASALGVAKGTLYLYVEGKGALFDLVCRSADRSFERPAILPVPTPPPRATLNLVARRIATEQALPTLSRALAAPRALNRSVHLHRIVGELYDTLARNRTGIKLIDRSARDLPALGDLWFRQARGTALAALCDYLERLPGAPLTNVTVAARFVIETCAFWAVHRHWDRDPTLLSGEAFMADRLRDRWLVRVSRVSRVSQRRSCSTTPPHHRKQRMRAADRLPLVDFVAPTMAIGCARGACRALQS